MQTYTINQTALKSHYQESARSLFNKSLNELNPYELNAVIEDVVKNKVIMPSWENSMNLYSEQRIAIYFSMEFLIGRVVLDALTNAGLMKVTNTIFKEEGIDIKSLEEVDDTALGNGGLGRLAACFIESAATMRYPLYGAGLYYKYGLFKQSFDGDGNQVEIPDDWTANGESWIDPLPAEAVIVEYKDTKVKAVPYIMPIIGYNESRELFDGNAFPLMLWKAEPIEGETNKSAAKISDVLYPDDKNDEGKKLRMREEYFFVSATLQRIFKIHLEKHGTLDNIEDYYIFQMNDTHPVFACLEFIRLLQLNGYSFDKAFEKAKKCFAYTNHTVLSEALEKWPINLFKDILPNLYKVIQNLNQKLIDELLGRTEFHFGGTFAGKPMWDDIREYELFNENKNLIYMANIACFISCKINGVAAVHTEILKKDVLSKWYKVYPERFHNKTNGVTPRRWIKLANPHLANFLDKYVGSGWVTDLSRLERLERFKNEPDVLAEFANVKNAAKQNLIDYIEKVEGVHIDSDSIIDCQVKRIHMYKRQDMNALRILYIYDQLKKGNLPNFYKTTFIIGGKAAASYTEAKRIIKLIKDIQNMVNNDPDVNDKMKVVFITNYNVSYGEKVYAGADFSEQISTAGKEASGTGNMKFMMNGSPTIGTMDGANIEIVEEASYKNNYIFGATVDEFKRIKPSHNHQAFLAANRDLVDLLSYLKGGRGLKGTYNDIVDSLMSKDQYFVMYDLRSYIEATMRANANYAIEKETGNMSFHTRKCLKNTAHSGKFSSDRTVLEYINDVWHIEQVKYS